MTIEVKDGKVLKSLLDHQFDPRLYMIIEDLLLQYENVVITEGWRKAKHGDDLHATDPVRALDLRSWIYLEPYNIKTFINKKWEYDPQRPEMNACVYHNSGHGNHFHIQVHPNTRRR